MCFEASFVQKYLETIDFSNTNEIFVTKSEIEITF